MTHFKDCDNMIRAWDKLDSSIDGDSDLAAAAFGWFHANEGIVAFGAIATYIHRDALRTSKTKADIGAFYRRHYVRNGAGYKETLAAYEAAYPPVTDDDEEKKDDDGNAAETRRDQPSRERGTPSRLCLDDDTTDCARHRHRKQKNTSEPVAAAATLLLLWE